MEITIEQMQAGIVKYIDEQIAPKAVGFTKFVIYFLIPSIPKIVNDKVKSIKDSNLMSDLFSENGNIKLDEFYARTKKAIEQSGKLLIPQINYFVDMVDVDTLYSYLKKS